METERERILSSRGPQRMHGIFSRSILSFSAHRGACARARARACVCVLLNIMNEAL